MWRLDVRAELLANGSVRWLVKNWFAEQSNDFGGPFELAWNLDPTQALQPRIVSFVDILSSLVAEWPEVRDAP